ncbi:1-aminocyclopropane-1-carboxylate synthase 7 [Trichoderma lentiforme]|uniref:1-aminocyclopropane-1-carboxylate synthase 7 n=1 Tax=Trichoderma lentiforme TaxID=1567552 RepID=A0A9P5C7C5_9HYPO|nr:1-aminocyclopropane-1-carboxylate synthase 7 [Trichoderma lentiforme]
MQSTQCEQRNQSIIPSLLSQHGAVLTGDVATVDLSTAENWFLKEMLLEVIRAAQNDLSEEDLAYATGIGGSSKVRNLMAKLFNSYFRPAQSVEVSHIVLAAGGSFALTALVEQICNPGDGILIATPYWAGLDISISIHTHGRVLPVDVPLDKFFLPESVEYYEEALRTSSMPVKAILLCNPHNPLGQCYPRETLDVMKEFCRRRNLHYISDEVYALSSHHSNANSTVPFVSALEMDQTGINDQVHIIYSLSKDFGCNGIRVGALITLNKAIRLSAALSTHSQVSSLSTAITFRAIFRPSFIEEIADTRKKTLSQAYSVVSSFLYTNQTEFIPAYYGMFVFARLHNLGTDFKAEERLLACLKTSGVSLSTGSSYHFNEAGWFRICYAVPITQLQEGLRRIAFGVRDYLTEMETSLSA